MKINLASQHTAIVFFIFFVSDRNLPDMACRANNEKSIPIKQGAFFLDIEEFRRSQVDSFLVHKH